MNRTFSVTLTTIIAVGSLLVTLTAWLVSLQMHESFTDAQVQVLRQRVERLEQGH